MNTLDSPFIANQFSSENDNDNDDDPWTPPSSPENDNDDDDDYWTPPPSPLPPSTPHWARNDASMPSGTNQQTEGLSHQIDKWLESIAENTYLEGEIVSNTLQFSDVVTTHAKEKYLAITQNYLDLFTITKDDENRDKLPFNPFTYIRNAQNCTDTEKQRCLSKVQDYQKVVFYYTRDSIFNTHVDATDLIRATNKANIRQEQRRLGRKLTIQEGYMLGPCPHKIELSPANCIRCQNPCLVCWCYETECDQCWMNYFCSHANGDKCESCAPLTESQRTSLS